MANKNKTNKVQSLNIQSLKGMPSDQLTELVEGILAELISNSKMEPKLKDFLVKLVHSIENAINPDGPVVTPVPEPVPTISNKGWFGKVLNYVITIASFVLPFILKGKGITLAKN